MYEGKIMFKEKKALLKNRNILLVLNLIRRANGISRVELSKTIMQTTASITKVTKKLIDSGFVIEEGNFDNHNGRPAKILKLNEKIGNIITLYFDGELIRVILYTPYMNKLYEDNEICCLSSKEEIMAKTFNIIETLIKISELDIMGVGIYLNWSLYNQKEDSVIFKWIKTDFVQLIKAKFSFAVYIEDDVKAMAIGEKTFGIAKKYENFFLIKIDNRVGGAIYINNDLYRGKNNNTGEFGHIFIEGNNRKCTCGKLGCLETLISNNSLEEKYFFKTRKQMKIEEIYSNSITDIYARELVNDAAKLIAKALISTISIIRPQLIIVVGELSKSAPYINDLISREIGETYFINGNEKLEISGSSFGDEGANLGAGSLLLENIFGN